jgi:large subunit ribosomal protein L18
LSISRSHRHIFVQLIDDATGKTVASAGSMDKELVKGISYGGNKDAATAVGKAIAERAKKAGVEACALDRGHCKFHGRVAALAEAAREAGLQF